MNGSFLLGCSPGCWVGNSAGASNIPLSAEQYLAEMALIGFQGVELNLPLQKELETRGALLQERGLTAISAFYPTRLLSEDFPNERHRLESHIRLLKQWGVHTLLFTEETDSIVEKELALSSRPTLERDRWQILCHGLDSLDAVAQSHGLTTAYLPHAGTVIHSESEIDKLMNMTSSLGLAIDTGHLVFAGAHTVRLIERQAARIRYVRLRNVSYQTLHEQLACDASYRQALQAGTFTIPGENGPDDTDGIDALPIVTTLLLNNYSGYFVIAGEQLPRTAPSIVYARLGYYTGMYLMHKASRALAHQHKQLERAKEEQLHAPF